MKSIHKTFVKIIVVLVLVTIIIGFTYSYYVYYKYIKGEAEIYVNGKLTECNSINEINYYIDNNIITRLDTLNISSCVSLDYDSNYIDNISYTDYWKLKDKRISVVTNIENIDYEKLNQLLQEYNKEQSVSIDANIVTNGTIYNINSDKTGNKIDIKGLITDLQNNENTLKDIHLKDYVIQPHIKAEDLQDVVNEANRYINWVVEYKDGQKFKGDIKYVTIENGAVKIDSSFVVDIVKELEKTYDTAGKGFVFVDQSGQTRTVTGGTYGNIMNSLEEREYLTQLFESSTSEHNRKPIMKQECSSEIGDTYIEVSIQDQYLWHFVNGELCCETKVVTGDTRKHRDTPTGVYFISEMINGKYLTGDTYKTWVNKWMRLTNTGIGLHDAGWRSSFGGNVYKGNGSHGCINLPKKYAYKLFDEVQRGTPVIIY